MAAPDLYDRLTRGWRAWALITLLSLAASLPGVFTIPPLDRDESRFAQATTQMLETGDFVRIAVQDQPRNKKPVGIHWLQSLSVGALSNAHARAIWAYRLPSVLGALLAALATFWGGAPLLGRRIAFLGAALFACSVLIGVEGMTAKTDAVLCGLTTLAMAALARLRAGPKRPRALALLFWAALGAGVLIKGPVTPLAAGGALGALYFWERKAAWMKPLRWWPGPVLALLIVAPWGIAIWIATHGRFFSDAIGGDLGGKIAGGDEGHSGPPLYHAALVWLLLFPATIALPGALRLIWRAARAPRGDDAHAALRFLIAWAAPLWLVFELLPTKLPHYVLPAYPALALLCAAALIAMFDEDWKKLRVAARVIAPVGALILIGACAALSTFLPGDADAGQKRAVQTALVGAALLAPIFYVAWRAKRAETLAAAACAVALGFAFTARERILPRAHDLFLSDEASKALMRDGLHPRLNPDAGRLTVIGDSEPSLVFLTRTDTRLATGAAGGAMAQPREVFLVEANDLPTFEAILKARRLVFLPVGEPAEGYNYSVSEKAILPLNGWARDMFGATLKYSVAKRLSLQPGLIISSARAKAP